VWNTEVELCEGMTEVRTESVIERLLYFYIMHFAFRTYQSGLFNGDVYLQTRECEGQEFFETRTTQAHAVGTHDGSLVEVLTRKYYISKLRVS
jgi:hypothetical protein